MKVIAVIPARYGSTRFKGKPLAMICGKPMVQYVYENAVRCKIVDRVVVATDDETIQKVVEGFGGEVFITKATHETGTDRVAEVARHYQAQFIVNLQGDEPLLPPTAIEDAVLPLLEDNRIVMSTLKTKLRDQCEATNPNIVKVVTDHHGYALYFSRSPIPYHYEDADRVVFFRHIGLYVYTRAFLMTFTQLPQTKLEKAERLEQLRALEHGYRIRVVETAYSPIGVDVPEDIEHVERILKQRANR
ncbi:MAG: 3-deoxy-manno-octulosonate cytidylyltransferase [Desulfobacterota bacterium]|nr:3-deoxy-manno-octulosonate cytidylyltransferase [Thermodesulfobacteriota bacterium]